MSAQFAAGLLQASVTVFLLGLVLGTVLWTAVRLFPVLRQHRAPWLGVQLVLVLCFVVVQTPAPQHLSAMPAVQLDVAPADMAAGDGAEEANLPTLANLDSPWLLPAAYAWLVTYALGLGLALWRQRRAAQALRELLRHATKRDGDVPLWETELPVGPMVLGSWRPRLLWPRALDAADPLQRDLILRHELTHLERRDPLLWGVQRGLSALLWFVPGRAWLLAGLRAAQEFGCDRAVLGGATAQERFQYAQALLAQYRAGQAESGLAFGATEAEASARLRLVRDGYGQPLRWLGRGALAAGFAAALALALGVQPAFAWHVSAAEAAPDWRLPLEQVKVTGLFGVKSKLLPNGHRGIDMRAPTGTPVFAIGAGRVVVSTDHLASRPTAGKLVVIEHADGLRSAYLHLDSRDVHVGDVLVPGQRLGASGATGRVTGPHLHLEVLRGDTPVDPLSVVPGLKAFVAPTTSKGS